MTATLPPAIRFQPFVGGQPLPGGKVKFYIAGTSTPQAVYAPDGTTPIGTELTLDANGATDFRLGDGMSYKVDLLNSAGAAVLGWPVDLVTVDTVTARLADSSSINSGDKLIAVNQPFTSAVATTQHDVNARVVHALDFMTDAQRADWLGGTGSIDSTDALNAATAYAHSLTLGNLVLPYDTIRRGGTVVKLPRGKGLLSSGTLLYYDGVIVEGEGKFSTWVKTTYDGVTVRNVLSNYDMFGAGLRAMTFEGDRTKTNQTGPDILRDWFGDYSDLLVINMGGTGIRFRQCISSRTDNLEALQNVGAGVCISDGIPSWPPVLVTAGSFVASNYYTIESIGTTDFTLIGASANLVGTTFLASGVGAGTGKATLSNNLPSNGFKNAGMHAGFNDGPGVKLVGLVDGCIWYGGGIEYNYRSGNYPTPSRVGFNIEINCASTVPNEFNEMWTEGGCNAHLSVSNVNALVRFNNWHHFGNGASGNVNRAAIVSAGNLYLSGGFGHGDSYQSISGSISPFQLVKAGPGRIYARDVRGSTVPDWKYCEDSTNISTGLDGYFHLDSLQLHHGRIQHYAGFGQTQHDWYQTGDAQPWLSLQNFYKGIAWGPGGSTALDTYLQRTGTRTLGMGTQVGPQFFDQGSAWNGNHALMGGYHLWVDGSGRLRIKIGAPASDTDGTVVGTQT